MAKAKKLNIEFAFGMPSGAVWFVVAGCLSEALRKVANVPKSVMDRKKLTRNVAMRPSEADDVQISSDRLLWWTVLTGAGSTSFERYVYPGEEHLTSKGWLQDRDAWKWGLTPTLTRHVSPHIDMAVRAREART